MFNYDSINNCEKNSDEKMVIFKGNHNIDISLLKNHVDSIVSYDKEYKVLYGNGYIVDKIGDYSFIISPDSFFQVNTNGAYNLYSKVGVYLWIG